MNRKMCLVIGYGSIGSRHVRVLQGLEQEIAVVSRRNINVPLRFSSIDEAVSSVQPDYIVIANKTSEHAEALAHLMGNNQLNSKDILVEKPLFSTWGCFQTLSSIPTYERVFVAYNLRFHPLLQKLKTYLKGQRLLAIHCYVGQYLPSWRPDIDYRTSYSVKRAEGGGVLRDLSHELDFVQWIGGSWQSVAALGGKYSLLEIDSDDQFSLIMQLSDCPHVTIKLNYLDRITQRHIIVHTDEHTYRVDLIASTIQVDLDGLEEFVIDRDETYRLQHLAVLADTNSKDELCTFSEGLQTVRLIEAAEVAVSEKRWVMNDGK